MRDETRVALARALPEDREVMDRVDRVPRQRQHEQIRMRVSVEVDGGDVSDPTRHGHRGLDDLGCRRRPGDQERRRSPDREQRRSTP